MTVTYHAGRRLQGLDADRTATQLPAGAVGGWVELGRTTLGSDTEPLSVSSLPDKRYYMILSNYSRGTVGGNQICRINSDSGSNYSDRYSVNGGADGTQTSVTGMRMHGNLSPTTLIPYFTVGYTANYASKEKLFQWFTVKQETAGASNAPTRAEAVNKWANTSNAINSIGFQGESAGTTKSGSEMVVLGYDPLDTHTNNYWEELLSETVGSDTSSHTFSNFTAKKYLWIQLYYKYSGSGTPRPIIQFNGDTGNNYAERRSDNGGADNLATSANQIIAGNWDTTNTFSNFFIINNASNEKLGIQHWVNEETAGASTAPHRRENVFKWANTSNQITSITLKDTAGASSIDAISKIKVWGAD
jgi:hypothetical protein